MRTISGSLFENDYKLKTPFRMLISGSSRRFAIPWKRLAGGSIYLGDLSGQVFTLFILTVAAAEAAIGLAIIVVYYRNSGTIRVEEIDRLKG